MEVIHAGFSGGMSVFLPLPSLPLGLFLPHIHIMGTRMSGLRQKAKGKKRRKEDAAAEAILINIIICEKGVSGRKLVYVLLTSSPCVFRGWFRLLLFSFSLFSSSSASAYLFMYYCCFSFTFLLLPVAFDRRVQWGFAPPIGFPPFPLSFFFGNLFCWARD